MGPSNSCGSCFVKFPNLFQPPFCPALSNVPSASYCRRSFTLKTNKQKNYSFEWGRFFFFFFLSGVVLTWLNLGFLSNHPPSPRGNHIVGVQTVSLLLLFPFPFLLITTPGNPEFFRQKGVSLGTHIHSPSSR